MSFSAFLYIKRIFFTLKIPCHKLCKIPRLEYVVLIMLGPKVEMKLNIGSIELEALLTWKKRGSGFFLGKL